MQRNSRIGNAFLRDVYNIRSREKNDVTAGKFSSRTDLRRQMTSKWRNDDVFATLDDKQERIFHSAHKQRVDKNAKSAANFLSSISVSIPVHFEHADV